MVAAMTATPDTTNVAVFLSLTGAGAYSALTIVRTETATGVRTALFGGTVVVTGGAWAQWDYEPAMDTAYTYTAEDIPTATVVATVALAAIASGDGRAFLKCPPAPALNMQVYPTALPALTTVSLSGKHQVLSRPFPIVVTTTRAGPTFPIELQTTTAAERTALRALLSVGSVLLLSTPPATGLGNVYVDVGDVVETPTRRLWSGDARLFTLPCTQTDRPVGASLGGLGVRWSDVLATYPTWAAVLAAKPTWLDLLQGVGATNPPV